MNVNTIYIHKNVDASYIKNNNEYTNPGYQQPDTSYVNENDIPIAQDDSWHVIDDYFDTYGLVRQQLDSFNEFLEYSIQRIVNEAYTLKFFPKLNRRNRDGKVCIIKYTLNIKNIFRILIIIKLYTNSAPK